MAAQRFGALDLIINTDTVLMSGANGFDTTCNVRFTNRNSAPVKVRLALVDDISANALTNLELEDYLEFDVEIRTNGVLENTGMVVPQNFTLVARADSAGVSVCAFGFEEQIV